MADEKTTAPTPEDLAKYASFKLGEGMQGTDEEKNKVLAPVEADLKAALAAVYADKTKATVGITKDETVELATKIVEARKNIKEGEPVVLDLPKVDGLKTSTGTAEDYLNRTVLNKIDKALDETVTKAQAQDARGGGTDYSKPIYDAVDKAADARHSKADADEVNARIAAAGAVIPKLEEEANKTKQTYDKVGDETLDKMKASAQTVVATFDEAVDARKSFTSKKAELDKLATEEKKPDFKGTVRNADAIKIDTDALEALNVAAKGKEDLVNNAYKTAKETYKDGEQPEAFKRVMQAAIDKDRDAGKQAAWKDADVRSASTIDSDLKAMLSSQRQEKVGVETEFTQSVGGDKGGKSGGIQYGKAAIAAGLLAATAFGATRSGGTEPDENGQEQPKKMGFFGKITVALAAVAAVVVGVSAVKGGNLKEGFNALKGDGKWADKVKNAAQQGMGFGGRA